MKRFLVVILFLLIFPISASAVSIIPNFPYSSDFGIDTTAGSGRHLGTPATNVCYVDDLTDGASGSNGNGSMDTDHSTWKEYSGDLRYCLEYVPSPKTIIFSVSGNIDLASTIEIGGFIGDAGTASNDCDGNAGTGLGYDAGNYISLMGQTAPSPGILINDNGFKVGQGCHDVLIQHIAIQSGDNEMYNGIIKTAKPQSITLIAAAIDSYNIVLDHITIVQNPGMFMLDDGYDYTVSNSIFGEALGHPCDPKNLSLNSPHSKGPFGGNEGAGPDTAFLNNLILHNIDRNPNWKTGRGFIVNNVIFDYWHGIEVGLNASGDLDLSILGNYMIETDSTVLSLEFLGTTNTYAFFGGDGTTYPLNYINGGLREITSWDSFTGYVAGCGSLVALKEYFGGTDEGAPVGILLSEPTAAYWPTSYSPMSAENAKTYVLNNAGSRPVDRCLSYPNTTGDCDPIPTRYVAEVNADSNTPAFLNIVVSAQGCTPCRVWDGGLGYWVDGTCVQNYEAGLVTFDSNTRPLTIPDNPHQVIGDYTRLERWLHVYLDDVEIGSARYGSFKGYFQ